MKIMGYKRENGAFGVRNYLLILPTSVCATDTAAKIADQVPGAVYVPKKDKDTAIMSCICTIQHIYFYFLYILHNSE